MEDDALASFGVETGVGVPQAQHLRQANRTINISLVATPTRPRFARPPSPQGGGKTYSD